MEHTPEPGTRESAGFHTAHIFHARPALTRALFKTLLVLPATVLAGPNA